MPAVARAHPNFLAMSDHIQHKLKLTTVTPVAVGGSKGDLLSPYADFVFSDDGKQLHYLNFERLSEAFDEEMLREYVRQIPLNMDNNRSDFDLKSFLQHRFGKDLSRFFQKSKASVQQEGLSPKLRQHIIPMVKNGGQPYLPGSSLKGMLRTAMLYDWLVSTKAGEPELKRNVFLIGRLDELNRELYDLRLKRGDRNRIRDLERETRKLQGDIFDESKLFGPLQKRTAEGKLDKNYPGPDARLLRVTDTRPLSHDAMAVYALRRIRLAPAPKLAGGRSAAIPQVVEAIAPGQSLDFEVGVLPQIQNEVLHYWQKSSTSEVLALLGGFGKACIENELYELRDALDTSTVKLPFEEDMEGLIEFYEGLLARAEQGEVFLRLGFGKTVNDNSLILALLYGLDNQAAWQQFRRAFHRVNRSSAIFPVTRTLTPKGRPMGWVRLT